MASSQTNPAVRVALITGAATGIGAATARALAGAGFTVIGADVDDDGGRALFAELGAPHEYRHLDVRDADAWQATIDAVVAAFGTLDVVHLNAGVMSRPKGAPLMDDALAWFTVDGYRKVRDVNLDGLVYGIIAATTAPGLKQIIVTASGAAILPLQMDPYYTMTKYGALGLGLALEPSLAERGIRIDILCPGAIDTGLTAPDIRAAIKQEPTSFIADCVVKLVDTHEQGPVWLAFSEAQGMVKYDPPGLPGMTAALDVVEAAD